jgi:hypothetical protein
MFLFALLFLQLLGTIGATEGIVMGQIVLYLAMSVDGYIADEQGGVGWLAGDGSEPDAPRQLPGIFGYGGRHRHGLDHLSLVGHGALPGQPAL